MNFVKKCFMAGFLFAAGMGTFGLIAAVVSGTMHTFQTGEQVSASKINENFDSLRTAINGINPAYSGSEVATGEVWTDGKAIYRKVVDTGPLPNAATRLVAHGISGSFTILSMRGMADNGTAQIPLPFVESGGGFQLEVQVSPTDISLQTAGNLTSYTTSFIVLEYTKN